MEAFEETEEDFCQSSVTGFSIPIIEQMQEETIADCIEMLKVFDGNVSDYEKNGEALALIQKLAKRKYSAKTDMRDLGLCEIMKSIFDKCMNDENITADVCRTLKLLLMNDNGMKASFGLLGMPASVLECLKIHSENITLIEAILQVLCELCNPILPEPKTVAQKSAPFAASFSGGMGKLMAVNKADYDAIPNNTRTLGDLGACELVADIFKNVVNSPCELAVDCEVVCIELCNTVAVLAHQRENAKKLAESGVFKSIVAVLHCKQKLAMVKAALLAVIRLCSDGTLNNKQIATENKVMEAIFDILKEYGNKTRTYLHRKEFFVTVDYLGWALQSMLYYCNVNADVVRHHIPHSKTIMENVLGNDYIKSNSKAKLDQVFKHCFPPVK